MFLLLIVQKTLARFLHKMRRRPPLLPGGDVSLINGAVSSNSSRQGLSWYGCTLILSVFLFFALILIGITLSLTITSPEARVVIPTFEFPTFPPVPNTTTTIVTGTTSVPTTTAVPTTVPVLPNVTIVCPANVTLVLGQSLDPTVYPVIGGNCSSAPLIVEYFDATQETFARRQVPRPRNAGAGAEHGVATTIIRSSRSGKHIYSELLSADVEPQLVPPSSARLPAGGRVLRSPSFNSPNLILQGTIFTWPLQNISSDTSLATSAIYTVMYDPTGRVFVLNKTDVTLIATFVTQDLAPFASACSNVMTNYTFGESQVVWDYEAQRWLFFQMSTAGGICIHVSSSNETNPALSLYTTYFYAMPIDKQLAVGRWQKAYVLSFVSNADFGNVSKLCVLERATLLNPMLLAVNQTAVMFCTHSYENNVPHAWKPVVTALDIPPSNAVETSAAPSQATQAGAVFMRVVDDEFYRNGSSPTVDQIEVEQWYSINFTTATFGSIRYVILMQDFDDRWNATVETPVTNSSLIVNKGLQGPVKFFTNSTCMLTFTSSNATVYWVELKWQKPNLATPERWVLTQQGNVSQAFAPALQRDSNGTVILTYLRSNNATYPSLFVVSRLANDPLNGMRQESLVTAGAFGSLFNGGGTRAWNSGNVVASYDEPRTFMVTGLVSSMPPQAGNQKVLRVRVLGEVIERLWRVTDSGNCGGGGGNTTRNATCMQYITTL